MNVLAKVLIWLPTTQSGDGSELILHNHGAQAIWSDVCSEATTCSVERCRPDRAWNPQAEMLLPGLLEGNIDFYHHARQQSEEADIVIVNHALLLADIANGGRILPSYQHLIIDEGHRLEEVATQQFTYRADWHQLQRTMQRLDSRSTLMLGIRGLLRGETGETIYATLLEMDDRGQRLLRALKSFADQLAALCAESKDGQVDLGYAQRIHVTGGLRAQPEWSQIEIRWGVLRAHLAGLLEHGWSIIERMENAQ